jgi:hypothetical protein
VEKLGARAILIEVAEQLLDNRYVILRNPGRRRRQGPRTARRLVIGRTDGGRALTLVVERTREPTTWLIVTGWDATVRERKILARGLMQPTPAQVAVCDRFGVPPDAPSVGSTLGVARNVRATGSAFSPSGTAIREEAPPWTCRSMRRMQSSRRPSSTKRVPLDEDEARSCRACARC